MTDTQRKTRRVPFDLERAKPAPPAKGWVCAKCGTDRTKAACPKGHGAALTGDCPMVGAAQSANANPPTTTEPTR